MSLATRCTACGTIFRVVEDQLRVSEGWVRCGRCAEVFDAREQLFDIDREAPPPWPPQSAAPIEAPHSRSFNEPPADDWAEPAPHSRQFREQAPESEAQPPTWPNSQAPGHANSRFNEQQEDSRFSQHPSTTEHHLGAAESREFVAERTEARTESRPEARHDSRLDSQFDARQEPQWDDSPSNQPAVAPAPREDSRRVSPPAIDPIDMGDGPDVLLSPKLLDASKSKPATDDKKSASAAESATSSQPVPEFLRKHSDAKSSKQGAALKWGLGLTAVLLFAALLLQFGLQFRDALAAQQAPLRPALEALCQLKGCELKPWHNIEAISVETSALNQAGAGNHYKLQVGLRNKSKAEVATPWVELSLTDASGKLLAKRSLRPSELHSDKPAMAPGSELNLQALLSTGPSKVSGYSVEIFYP
ncbi:DUF3426 domain-containing protein [Paucibacter sp. Y2R2-4]|uniref:DUF3426 domain-containing protein n=1 Tax=Paucibacter sp. Y2R2-4 TaxID=2893553 RepID=UPI0021E4DA1E|nr:DUF3426 domain-containing protein [Paucibacter sp. Y2R2-4]MCV2349842.1 zinc-ribbon domain-containing protein [Paucibacter sp. Y2R2-4]